MVNPVTLRCTHVTGIAGHEQDHGSVPFAQLSNISLHPLAPKRLSKRNPCIAICIVTRLYLHEFALLTRSTSAFSRHQRRQFKNARKQSPFSGQFVSVALKQSAAHDLIVEPGGSIS